MGMCELPATVCIRGKEYKISEIMGRKGPRQNVSRMRREG